MQRGAFIWLTFLLTGFSSAIAEGDDEAALRADAQKVFKDKVGPFVNKYCTHYQHVPTYSTLTSLLLTATNIAGAS